MRRKLEIAITIIVLIAAITVCDRAWALDTPVVYAAGKGPNQINLTWGAVRNPGYGYRVEIQSTADARYANWTDITTTRNGRNYLPYWVTETQYRDPQDAGSGDGTPCQFPVFGLKNNTTYSFRIRTYARTDNSTDVYSAYSNSAVATTANYTVRYVSPAGNDSNAGNSPTAAWRHIYYAGQQAKAGTVVYIMAGSYAGDYLYVPNSGLSGSKIVFQADPGSAPVITSGEYYGHTGWITGSYVVVDGLKSGYDVSQEAWLVDGDRNAIVNCDIGLTPTSAGACTLKFIGGYNLAHNNYLHDSGSGPNGNDPGYILTMYGTRSVHNVAQYNHNCRGAHDTGLVKAGADYNKWLNNLMDGGWGLGWGVVSSQYNLVEGNEVANVQAAGGATYKVGIQVSADNHTVRRNVVREGYAGDSNGIEVSALSGSGAVNARIYNNVIYRNNGIGIVFYKGSGISSAIVANNIFYYNGLGPSTPYPGLAIFTSDAGAMNVVNNQILYKSASGVENPSFGVICQNYATPLSTIGANNGISGFSGNVTLTPGFVSESGRDFHLSSASRLIGAGVAVSDPVWGAMSYPGQTPSIGAFEYFAASSPGTAAAPAAPKNLRIIPQ